MSIPNVQGTARGTLMSLTEDHLTQLIHEAVQVQRHCKRARIHLPSSDSNKSSSGSGSSAAAKHSDKGGGGGGGGVLKRRLHADDINMALQWRGSEKIYATGSSPAMGVVLNKGGGAAAALRRPEDKKVVLADYLKSEMDIKPPHEVGLTVHWLAVDGVQPDIPQNPASSNKNKRKAQATAIVHRVEDDEEETAAAGGGDGVQVTQLLPRLLSEELQLYFSRITTAVEQGGSTPAEREQQDAALQSLARDPGLQELAPFMINYVTKNLYKNVGNTEHCRTLIRMANALLVNPHLHLELYLHQLLPAILTMVVAERLSSKPWDNHWSLRYESALCLMRACDLFGEDYAMLKSRVLRTLCDAIGAGRSLPTQFGGIVAVSLFGPKTINAFILPVTLEYWKQWDEFLAESSDLEKRRSIQMCQQATLDALSIFLGPDNHESSEAMDMEWDDLEETFGDTLVMLSSNEDEYAVCFI